MEVFNLNDLRKSYLMCKRFAFMKTLINPKITYQSIEEIIEFTLKLDFQPPMRYQTSFISCLIKDIEGRQDIEEIKADILSLLYDELLRRISRMSFDEEDRYFRLYEIEENERPVKIYENEASFVASGTTGLITWEASTNFIEWVNRPKNSFTPKWIFELGSGTGHLGICLKKILKEQLIKYHFSDGSSHAVENIEKNVKENFVESQLGSFDYSVLDWTTDESQFKNRIDELIGQNGNGALVGSDIIFDPKLFPSLLNLFQIYFNSNSGKKMTGKIYLSCKIRNESTFKEALSYFDNGDINVDEVHAWPSGSILLLTAK